MGSLGLGTRREETALDHRVKRDQASEYLRLALPLMARHGVPVTPVNYALWYTYVSGENESLRQALDQLIDQGNEIGQEVLDEIHSRFFSAFDSVKFEQARATLRGVVDKLGDSVGAASDDVSRYVDSLQSYSEQLGGDVNSEVLRRLVAGLTSETQHVHDASADLHQRLQESQREAEALREQLEEAREEATRDALTGLSNRRGLDLAMEKLLSDETANGPHCLLIADIDKFKRINDTYGHLLGDKVIQFVAKSINNCVKGKDLAVRFGGEEFVVLLPDTPFRGALAVAGTIRSTIESGRLVRSGTKEPIGTITISIGVGEYRCDEGLGALISRVDEALYRAKEGGRNRVEPETPRTRVAELAG